jgi:hypothetical protein
MVSRLPLELVDIVCEYDARFVLGGKLTWQRLNKERLFENPHPAAIKWILSQPLGFIKWNHLGCNTNQDAVECVLRWCPSAIGCENSNETATEFVLARGRSGAALSKNNNPLAIGYLLAHPNEIDWEEFVVHDDDRIADFLRDGGPKLHISVRIRSHNSRLLMEALNELENVDGLTRLLVMPNLCGNSCDIAVDWLLAPPMQLIICALHVTQMTG